MSDLETSITRHGLDRVREALLSSARNGLRLRAHAVSPPAIGSRLGGWPALSAGIPWPSRDGRPLAFLAQIRCEDVARFALDPGLPASGLLSFFYDVEAMPWGFDPADRGSAVVLHQASSPAPEIQRHEGIEPLPAVGVNFVTVLTLPPSWSFDMKALGLTGDEEKRYFELVDELDRPGDAGGQLHQLLGHPAQVQGDMQLECQLVTHGLYCGDATGYSSPRAASLTPGAADWRLLLQLDSDEDRGMMWGDMGMVYFWIRDADLRQGRFQDTWTLLQCG